MISTDLFGPVIVEREDGQYVMTIVDAFTNHATIRVIPNKSAISVAQALLDYIYARGVPNKILTDCGKEFNNELQSHLWTALQVQKTWTSPYYPSVNGQAEKMNDILATYLRKARAISEANKTDFVQYLGPLALHYNTTAHLIHTTTKHRRTILLTTALQHLPRRQRPPTAPHRCPLRLGACTTTSTPAVYLTRPIPLFLRRRRGPRAASYVLSHQRHLSGRSATPPSFAKPSRPLAGYRAPQLVPCILQ